MNFVQERLQKLLYVVQNSPFDSFEAVAALLIPLILVALMFNWRVNQSMKKQKKLQKRRENLLKKLNGNKKEKEEEDEVINEAIRLMEAKSKKLN